MWSMGAGLKLVVELVLTSIVIGIFLIMFRICNFATSLPKEIDGAALIYVAVLFVRNITDIDMG